jgi:hypothetical protein
MLQRRLKSEGLATPEARKRASGKGSTLRTKSASVHRLISKKAETGAGPRGRKPQASTKRRK